MEKLTLKGLLVLSFTVACAFLAFYLGSVKNVTVVYPHLFYIPIILAGVWYGKKAIYIAFFLSFVFILVTYQSVPDQEALRVAGLTLSVNVLERSAILIVVAYIIGFVSEKRAQVEAELKKTKDYLDDVIKSSADAIVVVDMEGRVQSWNKAAEGYMGYTADEVIGTHNKKFFTDPKEAERIMELVRSEGELKNYRTTVLAKDGRPVRISMSAALLRDKKGEPIGTVRVSRDITKETELEEEIKERRDNLNLILETMADGVYIVSKDFEVEFMNKVLIDEFGDQVGGICYDAFHNRDEPCPLCKNTEVMKGKTVRWEWHTRKKNKTYDLIENPLNNTDGTISKLTIFRDISERKQIENELRETCEKLADLDKMKRDFLNVVYHEMRSPLAPIVGYASLLEPKLTGREQKYVCTIENCARELEDVINRMLELARIDGKKVELIKEACSLAEVVRNVVKNLEPTAEAKKQTISTIVPEIEIQADKQKTAAIFTNLITNAIKYTPEGGSIEVMVEDCEEDVRVCVADTGIGIPAEHLPKIFERFYMVDTSMTRQTGSLGLGLCIVKEYVRLHGGSVWATSELGNGSQFFFTLPKGGIHKGS
jgi:PAS domain S-box-containing protein